MLSFLIKECDDCDELKSLICSLNGVLAKYGKNGWQNEAFMITKPLPYVKVKMLMYYKDILVNIKYNDCFYAPYTSAQIVSRVKAIIGGEVGVAKREYIIQYPVTTTTTSTSTTTTTSSSTSSTTTTTTTVINIDLLVDNNGDFLIDSNGDFLLYQ